jgi:hypothetical protein
MTRSAGEVRLVLDLAAMGLNQCEIARLTGIPRGTLASWVRGNTPRSPEHGNPGKPCTGCESHLDLEENQFGPYSYLLGLYLGDGSISRHRRGVFRMRISLDRRYPGIVASGADAAQRVLPTTKVSVIPSPRYKLDEVSFYSKHLPCLFPQHGPGLKHDREIRLEDWQREITDRYPWCFLRGLIHSDGSRFKNPAIHPNRTYWYTRYEFSNRSADIRGLFTEHCGKVGVDCRQANRWNISVARRASVELMDRHIGPKQ